MKERRQHSRHTPSYTIKLSHPTLGTVAGTVNNMSESGVFITTNSATGFSLQEWIEASITGTGWDQTLPSLTMEVVRVEPNGLALKFVEYHTDICQGSLTQPLATNLP